VLLLTSAAIPFYDEKRVMSKVPFTPGSLVRLLFNSEKSDDVYAVENYSENYGGYLLISPKGQRVHAKEENVILSGDDTYILDVSPFKLGKA